MIRWGRQTRSAGERGAVAVEFALVLPLLVMLLLGVATAGIALSHSLGLTNAVREGSRFAATTPYPPPAPAVPADWADDVVDRVRATQFDDPAETSKICVDLYKQDTGSLVDHCTASGLTEDPGPFTAPASTPAGECVVRVWAARTFEINGVLFNYERVMTRQSIAVYEREPCD
jgi:hypothetical protein